jgi:ABC-type Fe3+/spermidine/putrescine transport system ATPase subunit
MSDRIAVMRGGRIEQVAPPEEIFDRPATAYVADFIGSSNFWEGRAEGGRVSLPDGQSVETALDGPVKVMARPHNLRLTPGEDGAWRGAVIFHRPIGPLIEYHVEGPDGAELRVVAMRQERARPLREGAPVSISVLDPALCAVYPA